MNTETSDTKQYLSNSRILLILVLLAINIAIFVFTASRINVKPDFPGIARTINSSSLSYKELSSP